MSEEKEKLVKVFETGRTSILATAKSLLDNAGIEYRTQREYLQMAYGSSTYEILVFESDSEEAMNLLKEIEPQGIDESLFKVFRVQITLILFGLVLLILAAVILVKC